MANFYNVVILDFKAVQYKKRCLGFIKKSLKRRESSGQVSRPVIFLCRKENTNIGHFKDKNLIYLSSSKQQLTFFSLRWIFVQRKHKNGNVLGHIWIHGFN